MTAKLTASADGSKVIIGTAAEDALQIDEIDKTIKALAPYVMQGVPAGAVMDFAMNTAPAGWLECNGAIVSRTTYAALFAAIGTTWGAGDGSTTFQLPEMRGRYRAMAGTDGTSGSKTFGQKLGDAIRNITGTTGQVYRSAAAGGSGAIGLASYGGTPAKAGIAGTDPGDNANIVFNASSSVPTANENRPFTTVINTCIKT
jgi:microcystin-dependent protein